MGAPVKRPVRRPRRRAGVGIIENVFALALLTIALLSISASMVASTARVGQDKLRLRMQNLAADVLEVLRARPQSELENILIPGVDRPINDVHKVLGRTFPEYELDVGPFDGSWGAAEVSCQATRSEPVEGELIGIVVEVSWTLPTGPQGSVRLVRLVRRAR